MAQGKGKLMLLTLVHPDFLPPVYATAQCLRDLGYSITIITFDSFMPAPLRFGPDIQIETLGQHHNASILSRVLLRAKFRWHAAAKLREGYKAIISFSPFCFNTANAIKGNLPNIYFAMEVADARWAYFLRSPLTCIANYRALHSLEKAALVATPSFQRSAWMAGRGHLQTMPSTILNTAYIQENESRYDLKQVLRNILPQWVFDKKIVLYTGAVNERLCVKELVEAFVTMADDNCVLISTGFKENPYCNEIKQLVEGSATKKNIFLLPYVTREEMLALQGTAHIGACLMKEVPGMIVSQMIAPNKTGEYLSKGLYILGVSNIYMDMFATAGVGSMAADATVPAVVKALRHAIGETEKPDFEERIQHYVNSFFSMQHQVAPIVQLLDKL